MLFPVFRYDGYMKHLIIIALMFGMFFNLGAGYRGNDLFQVITSHPHDLEELAPHIETVYQNGRLWVVQLHENAPEELLQHLKPLEGNEKSYIHEGMIVSNAKQKSKKQDNSKLIVSKVEKENIKKDVEDLANNYETRYAASPENQRAIQATEERFRSMGYEVKEVCYAPDACSIVADKKGSTEPNKVILVMGHIDSVGESFAGADDNASGVAVILEMARVLKDNSNKKTVRFFITNGEELGLYGATYYAKTLAASNQIKNIVLAINMDMVGYNSNGLVELETEPEHEPLAQWFAGLAARYTSLKTKITLGAWGSDHVPFLRKGVPTMLTIENWDTKTPCYHQECDKPDTLNYDYATEIAKLNVAAVLTKDQE